METTSIPTMERRHVKLFGTLFLLGVNVATSTLALDPTYSADPTHRDIAIHAFALAVTDGFEDPNLPLQAVQDRLEAGAYLEDYEDLPGVVGRFFPDPWDKIPTFDFNGLLPLEALPLGSLADTNSGWRRGLPHGYCPLNGYRWPGSNWTTVEWAAAEENFFTWDNAVRLHREGKLAEAYECVGHLLHLLSDMSVPSHVKVVNHGASLTARRSGGVLDPDQAVVIVDEYERALSGGLSVDNVPGVIPDLQEVFAGALDSADAPGIPVFEEWQDYFTGLAMLTASIPEVVQYYGSPVAEGEFGHYKDALGGVVEAKQYGLSPPAQIGGRWTQFAVKTTARVGLPPDDFGPILPEAVMITMARKLVPRAVEYCAGLILAFRKETGGAVPVPVAGPPLSFELFQNYPNPFNPGTTIGFELPHRTHVVLQLFDPLGREVATLVDGVREAGNWEVHLDASALAGGVYLYRIKAGGSVKTKAMVLLR